MLLAVAALLINSAHAGDSNTVSVAALEKLSLAQLREKADQLREEVKFLADYHIDYSTPPEKTVEQRKDAVIREILLLYVQHWAILRDRHHRLGERAPFLFISMTNSVSGAGYSPPAARSNQPTP